MKKDYIKRFSFCLFSLLFYSVGNLFGIKAGVAGTNAWTTLSLGFAEKFGSTFGVWTFLISLIVVIADLIGKGKLGFGTILNVVLIPIVTDFLVEIFSFIPDASSQILGAVYSLIGQTIVSFATIMYTSPALGCGPRDTLLIIIGKKTPKIPIGVVKFIIEFIVMILGVILGAPFGFGTVLVMILQASLFQFACRVTRYEPRNVDHESVIDTLRIMRK